MVIQGDQAERTNFFRMKEGFLFSGTCASETPLYDRRMFLMTRSEQLVLSFILIAFVLGVGIRHWRMNEMIPVSHTTLPNR